MLISTAELDSLIADSCSRVVVLDVRWRLGQTEAEGRAAYLDGHIPGALRVDLDRDLSAPPSREEGRHPLPKPRDFVEKARRWGINNDSHVVLYDDSGGSAASRAWWLLRWAGLSNVALLDGGWTRWVAEGRAVVVGPGNKAWPGSLEFRGPEMRAIDIDTAARRAKAGVLLDARTHGRFTGEEKHPVDRRAGHIPGALSLPAMELIDSDQRFVSPERIRELLAERGVHSDEDAQHVAVYCGSGVTATHVIFAMELAGLPGAALFPGSWSQWAEDPNRPAETGEAR